MSYPIVLPVIVEHLEEREYHAIVARPEIKKAVAGWQKPESDFLMDFLLKVESDGVENLMMNMGEGEPSEILYVNMIGGRAIHPVWQSKPFSFWLQVATPPLIGISSPLLIFYCLRWVLAGLSQTPQNTIPQ